MDPQTVKTVPNGSECRRLNGTFAPGNRFAKGNPNARRMYRARKTVLKAVSSDQLTEIMSALVNKAKGGDVTAARLVLEYVLGKPQAYELPEPDALPVQTFPILVRVDPKEPSK